MCPPSIYFLTTPVISGAVDVSVCCCFIEGLGVLQKGSVNFVMGELASLINNRGSLAWYEAASCAKMMAFSALH